MFGIQLGEQLEGGAELGRQFEEPIDVPLCIGIGVIGSPQDGRRDKPAGRLRVEESQAGIKPELVLDDGTAQGGRGLCFEERRGRDLGADDIDVVLGEQGFVHALVGVIALDVAMEIIAA